MTKTQRQYEVHYTTSITKGEWVKTSETVASRATANARAKYLAGRGCRDISVSVV